MKYLIMLMSLSVTGCNIGVIPLRNQAYIGLPGFDPVARTETISSEDLDQELEDLEPIEEKDNLITRDTINVEHTFDGCKGRTSE